MPSPALIDPLSIDVSRPARGIEDIRAHNRQRFEMEMLSGIALVDNEKQMAVGFKHVSEEDFWVRGHVPGRPLFPGVLMIEVAAQLASYLYHRLFPDMGFLGFTGVDDVKFRGTVAPPCRLVIVGRGLQMKPRRMVCASQGFVGSMMIFEGVITGMPV